MGHFPGLPRSAGARRELLDFIIKIIIIINDNVYDAVFMTTVTARIHPVHLMNAD